MHVYTAGVYLSLGGTIIANNSHVDIDNIGTSDSGTDALLCHIIGSAKGDWYNSNGSIVANVFIANNTSSFVSDRDSTSVKLFRTNTLSMGGQFYCMANGTPHYYINICELRTIILACM